MIFTPQQIHKIERLLSISGGNHTLIHSQKETERKLFLENFELFEDLIKYAFDADPAKYGEAYKQLKTGAKNMEEIFKENISLLQDALILYRSDAEEEVYLTLLDKPTGDIYDRI